MKRLHIACLLASSLLLGAANAAADEPPPADATPANPDDPAEQARAHHRRGLELYDEGDYRLALVEFDRAYSIAPNYKVLYNIGQVHFQLNNYAKARLTLEQYLREGGDQIPEKRRADVQKDLATLKTRTAILTIRVNVPDAEVSINDTLLGKAPIEKKLVDAGTLRIQASHPGYLPRVREIALAGGDEQVVTIDITKTEPNVVVQKEETGIRGIALAGWIATGVLAAGAVGTGIAANATASKYETNRNAPIQGSPEDARADLDRQRSLANGLALTTDILAVSALALGGVSLYLTLHKPKPDAPQVRVQGTRATFSIGF